MRGLEQIRVLRLVTGSADLHLSCHRLYRIFGRMQRVTTRACNVARRMRTRGPVVGGVRLVAGEALRILLGGRSGCFRTKIDHSREWPAARLDMRAARPMACLALKSAAAEWPARVIGLRMPGMEHTGNPGIVMASEAGVRSLCTVCRIGMRRTSGRSSGGRRRHHWGIGRERAEACARRQHPCGSYASARKPPHSIRRGRNVVHDPHVRDASRTVTDIARLHIRRDRTENRAAFRILHDRG